jgi:hypothetical protein
VLARERLVTPGPRGLLSGPSLHFSSEYNEIEETMSPTALKIITDWLSRCLFTSHREALPRKH